jgi:NAD(P)-dependent dehydrogenase (short-subunit alcohol dehydrogenase family)
VTLDGRTYAIAGAGGSLGPHVARVLVAAGASVALGNRSIGGLAELADELTPARAHVHEVDLLAADSTAAWRTAVVERFGVVDGVIHLVGGWRGGTPLAEAPAEDADVMHDLLTRTVQHTARAFRDNLAGAGEHGRYVLISSLQAARPGGKNAAYAAAKAAAEAWTLALADDLKGTGATANVLAINALVTPAMREASPEKAFNTFQDVGEIAGTIAWLCSPAARKMSGQRVVLAGAH